MALVKPIAQGVSAFDATQDVLRKIGQRKYR